MKKLTRQDAKEIYELCTLLRDENARMSFTDIVSIEGLEIWFNDESVSLYGTYDADNHLIAMLKSTRGKGNKAHSAYLAAAVHPNYRKQSLASELTLKVLEKLKSEGILIARTYIYSWNTASIATIEKCGFQMSGRVMMHEYDEISGGYIDDLIYYKVL